MATIEALFQDLPNLRNGDPANYTVVHIAAGIPPEFHFLVSANEPPPDDFMRYLLIEAAMYSRSMQDAGKGEDEARKHAVVLACVRLGIRRAWRITRNDLIAAQTRTPAYYGDRHNETAAMAAAVPANANAQAQAVAANAAAFPLAAVRREYNALAAIAEFAEEDVLMKLIRFGLAMPVITGVILVKTDSQHHFIAQHKNVFRAVMRQILGSGGVIPFGLEAEAFEDIVAHKSTHPINSALMIDIARNPDTKTRLMAAGLASAAVRVPAQYGPESAMSAVKNLVRKAVAIGRAANVAVDITQFEAMAAGVTQDIDFRIPADRALVATRVAEFTTTHGVDLARCMGILQATCDNANIARPPLLRSYALARIAADNPAATAEGVEQMTVFYRSQRERARRGMLSGMAMFGADTPAGTDPLPTDETMTQILAAVLGSNNAQVAQPGQGQQGN